jgi:hypothetical protein
MARALADQRAALEKEVSHTFHENKKKYVTLKAEDGAISSGSMQASEHLASIGKVAGHLND